LQTEREEDEEISKGNKSKIKIEDFDNASKKKRN